MVSWLMHAVEPQRSPGRRLKSARRRCMAISNSLTRLLGVEHPIILAAMDIVADARLALAVSQAGGFGFLGAGYGDARWLDRELTMLGESASRARHSFGVGFITWSLA